MNRGNLIIFTALLVAVQCDGQQTPAATTFRASPNYPFRHNFQHQLFNIRPQEIVVPIVVSPHQWVTFQNTLTGLVSDLKDSKATINDLQTKLAGTVTSDLAAMKADISTTKTNLGTVTSDLATVKSGLVTTNSNLATTNTNLGTVTSDLATVKTDLGTAKTNLGTVTLDLATTKSGLITTNTNLATTNTNLGTVTSDLASVKTDLGTAKTNLGTVTSDLATTKAGLVTTNTNLATTNTNLGTVTSDLATTKADLVTTNTNLATVTSNFNGLKTTINAPPVYFYVQKSSEFSNQNVPITFDSPILNVGDAMNSVSGTFTAPRNGIYFFSFSGLSTMNSWIWVGLYVNGNRIAAGHGTNGNGNGYHTYTLQSTLQLNANDKVTVQIYAGTGALHDSNADHSTHFTGFLLRGL